MANRVVGSVVIIDSAMGNATLFAPLSGNAVSTLYSVNAIAFEFSNTLGAMTLTLANTATEQIAKFNILANALSSGGVQNPALLHFSSPQRFDNLKVPVLTAGTGWIYLA